MLTKITRLLIIALIIALCVAIIFLNPDKIKVNYGLSSSFELMGGVVYLIWFALGLTASLFFWVLYGVQTYLKTRALQAEGQKNRDFYKLILNARSELAAREGTKARDKWQKLIKKDPTDIMARVELSRALEQIGETREALSTLDKARAVDPANVEVLIRAAELNVALGNRTAALDNLALVLYHQPSVYAARMARDLSEQIGRIEDAIEYNKKYESLSGQRDEQTASRLAYLELTKRFDQDLDVPHIGEINNREQEYLSFLRKFVAKDRSRSIEAVLKLSELELRSGNINQAAEVLVKAAKEKQDSDARNLWRETIGVWLKSDDITRAIAAARTAARAADTPEYKMESSLDLCRLLLAGGQSDEALSTLDSINKEYLRANEPLGTTATYHTLRGLTLSVMGRSADASDIWSELSSLNNPFDQDSSPELIAPKNTIKRLVAPPEISTHI